MAAWSARWVNGLINLSVRRSIGCRSRVAAREERFCTNKGIFKKILTSCLILKASVYLNATEAQRKNVQQQSVKNDGGIFRRQPSSANLIQRDWMFNTVYTGWSSQRPTNGGIHTVPAKRGYFCLVFTTSKVHLGVNLVLRLRLELDLCKGVVTVRVTQEAG